MGQHHDTLGVSANATDAEIKKAYRKLSAIHHPDKAATRGWTEQETVEHEDQYKKINTAYQQIKQGIADPTPHRNQRQYNHQQMNDQIQRMMIVRHVMAMSESRVVDCKYFEDGALGVAVAVPVSAFINGGTISVDVALPVTVNGGVTLHPHKRNITLPKDAPVGFSLRFSDTNDTTLVLIPEETDIITVSDLDIFSVFAVSALDVMLGRKVVYTHPSGKKLQIDLSNHPQPITIRLPDQGLRNVDGDRGHVFLDIDLVLPKITKVQQKALLKVANKVKL